MRQRRLLAALAAASAVFPGASASAKRSIPAARVPEAPKSTQPAGTTGATFFGCPEAHTPYDYVAYCPPEGSLGVAEAAATIAPIGGCALPAEPWDIPAALDAAVSGAADKDRACMKALFIPEARLMFAPTGDEASDYKIQNLDDWIARTKSSGHTSLEEKQLNFRIDRYAAVANLWSLYTLRIEGKAVGRGINSIQAIKETKGWRIAGITVQPESATAPLPAEYLP
jgi:hypothetical protein